VSSLRALTVTVSSAATPLLTTNWPEDERSETTWETTWTPAGEGEHVLRAEASDWAGDVATDTFTVTVDALPPLIAIAPMVITGAAYYEPSTIDLTAAMTDTIGLASCRWQIAGGEWQAGILENDGASPPLTATCRAPWQTNGALPDGAAFEISMEATDGADHTTQVTETVTVDVMPPATGALTLKSDGVIVARGDTVASGNLSLDWTAATDGSGLGDYTVQWHSAVTDTVTTTGETVLPAGPLTSSFAAGEGQRVTVGLTSQDIYGQQTYAEAGPVYVDGPLTPDYIYLPSPAPLAPPNVGGMGGGAGGGGWLDSGCSFLGADRRASRHAAGATARSVEQRLHATWSTDALRIAWAGAGWDTAGDLFVYLDTDPSGGATTAFNPYLIPSGAEDFVPDGTTVTLPDGFGADLVAWAQDANSAALFRWTGVEWEHVAALGTAEYRHDAATLQTDLYLPFALLGVADPASAGLGLLAFASEEGTLRLWAALPATNPLNSDLAGQLSALAGDDRDIALTHAYRWPALGPGICPNGSLGGAVAYPDSDLLVNLSAVPAVASYSLLADGLFWLRDLLTGSPPPDVTEQLNFLSGGQIPLGPGTPVHYTLAFRNLGTGTAAGAFAEVTAQYDLRLVGAADGVHLTVPLGDVAPLADGSVSFDAFVDPAGSDIWAAVTVRIFDAAHPASGEPLEWLWANHRVDRGAPQFMGVAAPKYWLGPGLNKVAGYAYDDAGVAQVQLEINGAGQVACTPTEPGGPWRCDWPVAGSDGDLFQVRMEATDGYGQAGGWGQALPYQLDALPPNLTLDESATEVAWGGLVTSSRFALYGSAADASGIASVSVCVADAGQPETCGQAQWTGAPNAAIASYEDIPATPAAIGAATSCANPIVVTYPVSKTFDVADVALGLAVQHTHRDDLQVELTSPAGTTVRVFADDGLPSTHFANLNVMLFDAATTGLFTAQGDDEAPQSSDGGAAYIRAARPYAPLRAFQGQSAQGNWTLRICDVDGGSNDGAYFRSRLTLIPRDAGTKSASWSYLTPDSGPLDYVARTVSVFAGDIVGNYTLEPLQLQLIVDNVAPVITVTQAITEVWQGSTVTVLDGTVTDGGPLVNVTVHLQDPAGNMSEIPAARDGERWWFDLTGDSTGERILWVQAFDQAGNAVSTEPVRVAVICASATLGVTAITAEPAADDPFSVTVRAVISNTGAAAAPAGLAVGFYANGERIGTVTLAGPVAPGASQAADLLWPVASPGDYALKAIANDPPVGAQALPLCAAPEAQGQLVSIVDIGLRPSWSLVSSYVNPFNPNASVVQRPIAGQYVVIQGFDGGAQSYYPDLPPEVNTLKEMDGEHGYWIKTVIRDQGSGVGDQSAEDEDGEEAVATLRVVGEKLAEDHPIELDAGWNLVSYLPRQPLAVADALQSIDGKYTVVLGYDQGALSYYPDIDPSFNTLREMKPMFGYWIKMVQAGTLQYPIAEQGSGGAGEQGGGGAIPHIREAERAASVMPTNTWVNFYGPASLPVGTVVQAMDPDGVVCGATVITREGQYGLLACYGDDPATPGDEGARLGDTIQLVVDGQVLGVGTCSEHGDRQWRPLGQVEVWSVYLPLIRKGSR